MLQINTTNGTVREYPPRTIRFHDRERHGIEFAVERCGPVWEVVIRTWMHGRLVSTQRQTHLSEREAEESARRMQGEGDEC